MQKENTQMDHSVRGYLSRRTTERLDEILLFYLRQEVCAFNQEIIATVLDILREREKNQEYEISPELLALYRRLYGDLE